MSSLTDITTYAPTGLDFVPNRTRKLDLKSRLEIRGRLNKFVSERYPTRARMEAHIGVGRSTASAWFSKNPTVPDTVWLVRLAERQRLSIDWLLFDEGDMLRPEGQAGPTVWQRLRSTLMAELRSFSQCDTATASKTVPSADDLFHGLVADVLAEWGRTQPRQQSKRSVGIARALEKLLREEVPRAEARAFASSSPVRAWLGSD